ncbi:MAG: hypothetical protein AAGL68_03100 [Pseudomonadota bacterium]
MLGAFARQLLIIALLVSIGLRTALGAPCCLNAEAFAQTPEIASAAQDHTAHSVHGGHGGASQEAPGGHGGHGDDPTANPCCSACGPTLPIDPVLLALVKPTATLPEPDTIRAFQTRPPFPAYHATGPPLRA